MKKLIQRVCMLVVLMIAATYGLSAQNVLNETFENGFGPNGWTQLPASATVPWTIGSSGVGSVTPYQGDNMVWLYSIERQDSVKLISKSLNVTGMLEPTLDFYIASPKFGTAPTGDTLKVYFKTDETWKHVVSYVTNSAAWQKKSINVKAYIANPVSFQVAFEWVYGNGKGIALDNIMVYGADACTAPVNLRTRNLLDVSANLTWNTNTYAISNRIKIFTSPIEASQIETASTVIDATLTFPVYEAAGLTPKTTYYWYVKSICTATDISDWSPAGQFTTLCATGPIPTVVENFDSYMSDTVPTCWIPVVGLVGDWEPGTSTVQFFPKVVVHHSSNPGKEGKSLSVSSVYEDGKSTVAYAVSPRFDTPMGTYQLKFKLRSPSVNHVLSVGTIDDVYSTASFKKATDISVAEPDKWQDVTVYLNTAAANDRFFAFKTDGEDGQEDIFFIDELEILEMPECATPIHIHSNNITQTDVDLSWLGNSASYEIKAYLAPSNPATDTPAASVQNVTSPHTLTGLQASNLYYIYIKGVCNGEWSQPITVETERAIATMPFFEDFESETRSWSLLNENQDNKWHIGTAVSKGGNKSLYISNDSGVTNNYNVNSTSLVYANQLFSLSAGKEYSLHLDWKGIGEPSYFSPKDYGMVYLVSTSQIPTPGREPGGAYRGWIQVSDYLSDKETWQTLSKDGITVPADGEYYLIFYWKNDISGGTQPPVAIDNIRFLEFTCGEAKNIVVTDVTGNSATITWSPATKGTPTQYSVYVVDEGVDYTTVTPQTTTNTTITITGLQQANKYDVYVVTNCSGADGNSFPATAKFLTKQTPLAIPYFEDFEGATISLYLENGDQANKWTVGSADHNGTGSKSMYISKDGNVREYDTTRASFVYAFSTFELSNGEIYKLKFDWKSYGKDETDIINVFLVPDSVQTIVAGNANDMAYANRVPRGWTRITDGPLFATDTVWQTLDTTFIVATSGRYKLVFLWKNTSSYGNSKTGAGAIDNVSLNTKACSKVNYITTEFAGNSLDINWTASIDASSWNIAVVPAGSTPTTFTNVTTPSYTLSPAELSSVYQVYIYANCGENTVSDTAKLVAKTPFILPFTTDFEDDNLNNFWTFSSSSPEYSPVNKWIIGTDANNGGTKGMYISKDNLNNAYNMSEISVDYAYVLFDLEQNEEYVLEYDWKGKGERSHDYMKAFIIPKSYSAGISQGNKYNINANNNDNMPAGWVAVSEPKWNLSNEWNSVETPFTVGATGKYYLAFFWENDLSIGEDPPAAIDNVSLFKILCKEVNNVVVSNITETGAEISWDAVVGATTYDVKVSTSAIDPDTQSGDAGDYLGVTNNNIDLSGNLTPSTTYYAYIRANCGNGGGGRYTMVRFSTLCEVKNIPYTENFDSYDHTEKTMPICWLPVVYKSDVDSIAGDFAAFVDSETVDGVEYKFLNMNVYYGASNGVFSSSFAILPEFAEPINSIMLSFKAKAASDSAKISVGTVSDINDAPATFVKLGEYKVTTKDKSFLLTLDGFSGPANSRIAFVVEGDKLLKTNSVFVDDVKLEQITNCATPTDINHTLVKNDSAILKWTSIYTSVKTFNVIVSTEDVGTDFSRLDSLTPAQTAFNQNVTGDSVVVTGLAESTTYYYYIRMVCEAGTYSPWFGDTKTFTTSCSETSKCQLIIKTKDADGRGWGSSNENPKLIILNSDKKSLGEYRVKQSISGGAASDTTNLDTLVLCPGDYIAEYTPSTAFLYNNSYNSFELILNGTPLYVSPKMQRERFLISFTINNGCTGFTCSTPDSLMAEADATEANITWTGDADSYEVRVYKNSNNINPSDTSVIPIFSQNGITATSVNATGLSSQTNYVVFVRSICNGSNGAKNSDWRKTVFSTSIHVPLETLPFATDFENDADNAKWVIESSATNKWIIDTQAPNQGTKSLYISKSGTDYSYSISSTSYSYAARKFSMNAGNIYKIDFDWKCTGESDYDLARAFLIPVAEANIGGANPNGMDLSNNIVPQGWIDVSDVLSGSGEWKHFKTEITVPADRKYLFAFFWKNDNAGGDQPPASIDNLKISIVTCFPPKNLALSNITPTSTDLAWSENSDKYTVRVYQTNRDTIDPDVHTNFVNEIQNITDTSTSITGLTSNTSYYLFVRGTCGTENSKWSKIYITTPIVFPETTLPLVTGFEDNADNAKWFFSINQTNHWVVGNVVSNEGAKAMYITNDTIAPFDNEYTDSRRPSYSYAFRKVELSANDVYSLSFNWRANGENAYDLGRAYLIPINDYTTTYNGIDRGVGVDINDDPSGWIDVGGINSTSANVLGGQNTWQSATRENIVVPTTGSYLLTFYWMNDHGGGDQPPLAIDNVAMRKIDCPGVIGLINLERAGNSIDVSWSGMTNSYTVKLFEYTDSIDIETATPLQQTTVTTTNHNFGGIEDGKIYLVAVQGNCGAINSTWKTASIFILAIEDLPILTDFQNAEDNQKWRYSNSGDVNKWVIGNAVGNEDTQSMYISNDNGASNSYNGGVTAYSYAYRTVSLDASKSYITRFFWKAKGDTNYDLLRAFIIPISADIADGNDNGMSGSDNTTPAGWIDIASPEGKLSYSELWTESEKFGFTVPQSGTYHLAFFWKNNGSGQFNPPAAVDNVVFKEIETVELTDKSCLGEPYNKNNFDIPMDSIPAAGVYNFTTTYDNPNGNYQIINLTLTVINSIVRTMDSTVCRGEEINFFGRKIVAATSGEYNHYTYSISTGCDSVVRLNLTVNPSYTINIDTVITSLPITIGNRTFPAGYPNGEYLEVVSGTTASGCDSTTTYNVVIAVPVGLDGANVSGLTIAPNPIEVGQSVEIRSEFSPQELNGLKVEVLNTAGSVLSTVTPKDKPIRIDGFRVSGVYVIRLTTGTGNIVYGKVIVK